MVSRTLTAATGIVGGSTFFAQLVLTDVPDVTDSKGTATAFYQVASHRSTAIVAFYVAVLVAIAISVFAHSVTQSAGHAASSHATLTAQLARAASTTFVCLYLAGAAAFAVPSISISVWGADVDVPFAETMSSWGDALLMVAAPLALAGVIAALTALRQRARQAPVWLTAYGYLSAALLLAAMLWFPLILAIVWFLAVGIHCFATRRAGDPTPVLA